MLTSIQSKVKAIYEQKQFGEWIDTQIKLQTQQKVTPKSALHSDWLFLSYIYE